MSSISLSLTIYILQLLSYYPAEMVVIKLPYTVPPLPLHLSSPFSSYACSLSLLCLISSIDQTPSVVCIVTPLSLLPLSNAAVMIIRCCNASVGCIHVCSTGCTNGSTSMDLHYTLLTMVTADLFIDSLFPSGLRGIELISNFFFLLEMDHVLSKHLPILQPNFKQLNNPIQANTMNVNWPYRHPFPICCWQHFWDEFLSEIFFFSHTWHCYQREIPIHHNNQCWVSIYQPRECPCFTVASRAKGIYLLMTVIKPCSYETN